MVSYKLRATHVEEYEINLLHIRYNLNKYPRVEKNYGDYSGTVITYCGYLCGNAPPRESGFNKQQNSYTHILSSYLYTHVGGTKYRI